MGGVCESMLEAIFGRAVFCIGAVGQKGPRDPPHSSHLCSSSCRQSLSNTPLLLLSDMKTYLCRKSVVLNLFHCWDPMNATDVVWDPQVNIEKVCAPEKSIVYPGNRSVKRKEEL